MKIVLQRPYRAFDAKEGDISQPGDVLDVSNEEGQRALDEGIALTPEDAAKSPDEIAAVDYLTSLGYTVTPPKVAGASAPAPKAPLPTTAAASLPPANPAQKEG